MLVCFWFLSFRVLGVLGFHGVAEFWGLEGFLGVGDFRDLGLEGLCWQSVFGFLRERGSRGVCNPRVPNAPHYSPSFPKVP